MVVYNLNDNLYRTMLGKFSKISNISLYLFPKIILVFMAGIHKMLVGTEK